MSEIFNNIKFYIIKSNDSQIKNVLTDCGAQCQGYLSESLSFVISDCATISEVGEAEDIYNLSVVTSEWVRLCLNWNEIKYAKAFHPSVRNLFSKKVFYLANIGADDSCKLKSYIQLFGGSHASKIVDQITHIVLGSIEGEQHENIVSQKPPNCNIVTPTWLTDCINKRLLLPPTDAYSPQSLYEQLQKQHQEVLAAKKQPPASPTAASIVAETPSAVAAAPGGPTVQLSIHGVQAPVSISIQDSLLTRKLPTNIASSQAYFISRPPVTAPPTSTSKQQQTPPTGTVTCNMTTTAATPPVLAVAAAGASQQQFQQQAAAAATAGGGGKSSKPTKSSKHLNEQGLNESEKNAIVMQNVLNILGHSKKPPVVPSTAQSATTAASAAAVIGLSPAATAATVPPPPLLSTSSVACSNTIVATAAALTSTASVGPQSLVTAAKKPRSPRPKASLIKTPGISTATAVASPVLAAAEEPPASKTQQQPAGAAIGTPITATMCQAGVGSARYNMIYGVAQSPSSFQAPRPQLTVDVPDADMLMGHSAQPMLQQQQSPVATMVSSGVGMQQQQQLHLQSQPTGTPASAVHSLIVQQQQSRQFQQQQQRQQQQQQQQQFIALQQHQHWQAANTPMQTILSPQGICAIQGSNQQHLTHSQRQQQQQQQQQMYQIQQAAISPQQIINTTASNVATAANLSQLNQPFSRLWLNQQIRGGVAHNGALLSNVGSLHHLQQQQLMLGQASVGSAGTGAASLLAAASGGAAAAVTQPPGTGQLLANGGHHHMLPHGHPGSVHAHLMLQPGGGGQGVQQGAVSQAGLASGPKLMPNPALVRPVMHHSPQISPGGVRVTSHIPAGYSVMSSQQQQQQLQMCAPHAMQHHPHHPQQQMQHPQHQQQQQHHMQQSVMAQGVLQQQQQQQQQQQVMPHQRAGGGSFQPNPLISRLPIYVGHEGMISSVCRDNCLVGCVFLLCGYENVSSSKKQAWISAIRSHGGEVVPAYCPTAGITHLIIDCQLIDPDFFKLILKNKIRIVSIYWVNDVIEKGQLEPPFEIIHLPSPFMKQLTFSYIKRQIVSITGFEGDERKKVEHMVTQLGVKYTEYLEASNTVLICKRSSGRKYDAAQKLGIACVNMRWLQDLYFGDLHTLSADIDHKYQCFESSDVSIRLERMSHRVQELMVGWIVPVRLDENVWKKYHVLKDQFEVEKASRKRLAETSNNVSNQEAKKPRWSLPSLTEEEIQLARSCALLKPGGVGGDGRLQSGTAIDSTELATATAAVCAGDVDELLQRVAVCSSVVVAFTGLVPEQRDRLGDLVASLGGSTTDDVARSDCSHLVAGSVVRTAKFYQAVLRGLPIVSPKWLQASVVRQQFLDEAPWQLADRDGEAQLGFRLSESLRIARLRASGTMPALFSGLDVFVSPRARASVAALVRLGGGTVRDKRPTQRLALQGPEPRQLLVCHEEDAHLAQYLTRTKTGNRAVHHEEFVLAAALRQNLDYDSYQIQYVLGHHSSPSPRLQPQPQQQEQQPQIQQQTQPQQDQQPQSQQPQQQLIKIEPSVIASSAVLTAATTTTTTGPPMHLLFQINSSETSSGVVIDQQPQLHTPQTAVTLTTEIAAKTSSTEQASRSPKTLVVEVTSSATTPSTATTAAASVPSSIATVTMRQNTELSTTTTAPISAPVTASDQEM